MRFNIVGSPYKKELESVTLEDGTRFYKTPEGKKYPSITTVLSLYNKKAIDKWKKRVGEQEAKIIGKKATERGNNLHELLENYIKGTPASEIVFQYAMSTVSLFQSLKPIIDQNLNNIHLQETSLYSDVLRVAGRVDCIGEWNGELAVIDFKGSGKEKKESWIEHYFMQASAYAFAYWEHTKIPIKKIVILVASQKNGAQVFEKNPAKYIQPFRDQVETYYRSMDNPT